MDLHGVVMLALIVLPFAVIGFVGGMLFMRANYLQMLRQERRMNTRLTRRMEKMARDML